MLNRMEHHIKVTDDMEMVEILLQIKRLIKVKFPDITIDVKFVPYWSAIVIKGLTDAQFQSVQSNLNFPLN
jgi:hypothetical protein